MLDARHAFAEALAVELDLDMSPEYLAACDRVLMRLWIAGYAVLPAPEEVEYDR